MCCLVRCRCVFYHLCKYFLIMMSATFLLLYYLDMILYENFFTSFLPSDSPTVFPKKSSSISYLPRLLSRSPSRFCTPTITYYHYYTGVHVHTGYTFSADISKKEHFYITIDCSIDWSILTGEVGKKKKKKMKIFKNLQKFAKPDLPNSDGHKSYLHRITSNESLNFRMVIYIHTKANCFPSFVTKKDLCIW